MGGGGEVEAQVFRQVPAQGEVAVPEILFGYGDGDAFDAGISAYGCSGCQGFQVAELQFVVMAGHVGVERDALGEPVQVEFFDETHPGRFAFHAFERFPRAVDRSIIVGHGATPVCFVLVSGGAALVVTQRAGVAECKVTRIVRHWILADDTQTRVAEAEVAVSGYFTGDAHQ